MTWSVQRANECSRADRSFTTYCRAGDPHDFFGDGPFEFVEREGGEGVLQFRAGATGYEKGPWLDWDDRWATTFDHFPAGRNIMQRFGIFCLTVALAAAGGTTTVRADVRLPAIIGNNMVLQADKPLPIWGWAEPGEDVTVTLRGRQGQPPRPMPRGTGR